MRSQLNWKILPIFNYSYVIFELTWWPEEPETPPTEFWTYKSKDSTVSSTTSNSWNMWASNAQSNVTWWLIWNLSDVTKNLVISPFIFFLLFFFFFYLEYIHVFNKDHSKWKIKKEMKLAYSPCKKQGDISSGLSRVR